MERMFKFSSFNRDICKWDVSNVTNMEEMFDYADFKGNINKWKVSEETNMNHMFMDNTFKKFRFLRFLGFKVVPVWYKEKTKDKK